MFDRLVEAEDHLVSIPVHGDGSVVVHEAAGLLCSRGLEHVVSEEEALIRSADHPK